MSKEALGMVETRGLTAAIEAADAMVSWASWSLSTSFRVPTPMWRRSCRSCKF